MRNPFPRILLLTSALATAACGPMPVDVSGDPNYEGLVQVDGRRLDIAYVRPGIDFDVYDAILLGEPELAFRTPDRSEHEFPLAAEQKLRFREMLASSFRDELSDTARLRLTDQAGPNVLALNVRVQDIAATLPSSGIGLAGRASIALEAVGEATLVLELRDSQSNEVLARGIDARAVEGVAVNMDGRPVTRWDDVERLCAQWAVVARRGLETLVNESQ